MTTDLWSSQSLFSLIARPHTHCKKRFPASICPVAARRIFSVAAEQSWTQNSRASPSSALFISPQTTIASGALAAMPALGLASASFCS